MLLTITSTTPPATDLGYLLYKTPSSVQTFEQEGHTLCYEMEV
jgi:hypothetical protein